MSFNYFLETMEQLYEEPIESLNLTSVYGSSVNGSSSLRCFPNGTLQVPLEIEIHNISITNSSEVSDLFYQILFYRLNFGTFSFIHFDLKQFLELK